MSLLLKLFNFSSLLKADYTFWFATDNSHLSFLWGRGPDDPSQIPKCPDTELKEKLASGWWVEDSKVKSFSWGGRKVTEVTFPE